MTALGQVVTVEQSEPATPATGVVVVYAMADGHLYAKDDTGTVRKLS
jgi:hypothetical protein